MPDLRTLDYIVGAFTTGAALTVIATMPYILHLGSKIRNLKKQNEDLNILTEKLEGQSTHDSLTDLYNPRFLNNEFFKTILASREPETLGLLYIDIENFKKVNDTYGHLVGDNVLIGLSKYMQNSIRSEDYVFRMGGEEFLMILNLTNKHKNKRTEQVRLDDIERSLKCALKLQDGLDEIREELRKDPNNPRYSEYAKYFINDGNVIVPRISIGVDIYEKKAPIYDHSTQIEKNLFWSPIINRLDAALYFAKIAGYAASTGEWQTFFQAAYYTTLQRQEYNLKILCNSGQSSKEQMEEKIFNDPDLKPNRSHFRLPPLTDISRHQPKMGYQVSASLFYFLKRSISPYFDFLDYDEALESEELFANFDGKTLTKHSLAQAKGVKGIQANDDKIYLDETGIENYTPTPGLIGFARFAFKDTFENLKNIHFSKFYTKIY